MTMIISERRTEGESFDRMYNRFSGKVREARLVRRVREKRYAPRKQSELLLKRRAIHATKLRAKREEQELLGL